MKFTSHQLRELTGITYRQLDYWTRLGGVFDVRTTIGSGNYREFDAVDVIVARAVATVGASLIGLGGPKGIAVDIARLVALTVHETMDIYGGTVPERFVVPMGAVALTISTRGPEWTRILDIVAEEVSA